MSSHGNLIGRVRDLVGSRFKEFEQELIRGTEQSKHNVD